MDGGGGGEGCALGGAVRDAGVPEGGEVVGDVADAVGCGGGPVGRERRGYVGVVEEVVFGGDVSYMILSIDLHIEVVFGNEDGLDAREGRKVMLGGCNVESK